MKKLALSLIFISLVTAAFADLYKPHRVFEIGVDAEVSVANNYLSPSEVLVKDLVIDLQKISDGIKDNGLLFDFNTKEKVFINLNISSHYRFGLFTGVEANGQMNLEQGLFKFLSTGMKVGDNLDFVLSGYTDAFYDVGLSFQTIIKDYGVKIAPSYYVPIAYMPQVKAKGSFSTSADGKIKMEAKAPVVLYTAIDMKGVLEDDEDINLDIPSILSNGGMDLTFEVERNILHGFNVGVFGRVPVVPGKLTHKTSMDVDAYFYEKNILGIMEDGEEHDHDVEIGDKEYEDVSYKIARPMRFGVEASYKPFGDSIFLQSSLDLAVRNLFTPADKIIYPEYDFSATFGLKKITSLTFGTAYQDMIFSHYIGYMLNFRLIELNARVAVSSSDFIHSFGISGVKAYAGVRIGY
ncbi:MAG: hypothetical protein KBT11_00810 [Treponema sp.]|nr:hypothetical protein [Candidatus Treponema equifaecale]